jgi:hypothetical protein
LDTHQNAYAITSNLLPPLTWLISKKYRLNYIFSPLTYLLVSFWSLNYLLLHLSPLNILLCANLILSVNFGLHLIENKKTQQTKNHSKTQQNLSLSSSLHHFHLRTHKISSPLLLIIFLISIIFLWNHKFNIEFFQFSRFFLIFSIHSFFHGCRSGNCFESKLGEELFN